MIRPQVDSPDITIFSPRQYPSDLAFQEPVRFCPPNHSDQHHRSMQNKSRDNANTARRLQNDCKETAKRHRVKRGTPPRSLLTLCHIHSLLGEVDPWLRFLFVSVWERLGKSGEDWAVTNEPNKEMQTLFLQFGFQDWRFQQHYALAGLRIRDHDAKRNRVCRCQVILIKYSLRLF